MATTLWCMPCGVDGKQTLAAVSVDGDPMCRPCADYMQKQIVREGGAPLPQCDLAAAGAVASPPAATGAPGVCAKGCGWPKHYGVCPPRPPEEVRCACGKPVGHRGRCLGSAAGNASKFVDRFAAELEEPGTESSPEMDIPITRKLCARGCGKPVHQGNCAGVAHGPQNLSDEAKSERARKAMATRRERGAAGSAVGLEVVDELPEPERPKLLRKGRMGEIWDALDTLPAAKWLKVPNRDRTHLGTTWRELRHGAAKVGSALEIEARGDLLYVRHCMQRDAAPPQGREVRA